MIADILITLLLVSLNGFFVAAEFAIVKVRASQLEMKVQSGSRIAIIAKNIVCYSAWGYACKSWVGLDW
jgi:CBS domain containing-hemolysin-like protein